MNKYDETLENKAAAAKEFLGLISSMPSSNYKNILVQEFSKKVNISLENEGKNVIEKLCPDKILDQLILGQRLGVNGTPTIFLEDGRIIPGYQSYEKILAFIKN